MTPLGARDQRNADFLRDLQAHGSNPRAGQQHGYASDSERNILKGTCPGKPVCTATQCIVSEKFSESATAIKDYYENKGVFNVLKAAGLIEETIHYLHEGSFYYPVVKVNF